MRKKELKESRNTLKTISNILTDIIDPRYEIAIKVL